MAPVFGLTHTSAVSLLRPVLGAVNEPSAWSEKLRLELNLFIIHHLGWGATNWQ